jgi:ribosome biogenesis GTPase
VSTVTGRVLAVQSAFCSIMTDKGVLRCSLRGRLRLRSELDVVPGDFVEVTHSHDTFVVERVLPRKNLLMRPEIANVEQAVVISAATKPPIDFTHLDKILVQLERWDIAAVVCFNKADIEDKDMLERYSCSYKKAGYPTLLTSAVTKEGMEDLKQFLSGKVTVLAGASGVGKSRILSELLSLDLETGSLSKLGRGKHTTKGVTLYSVKGNGFLADTPGFSKIDLVDTEPEDLCYYYPEFLDYIPLCHYPRCLHKTEDKCAVKEALAIGKISRRRYDTYLALLDEALEKVKHKYD